MTPSSLLWCLSLAFVTANAMAPLEFRGSSELRGHTVQDLSTSLHSRAVPTPTPSVKAYPNSSFVVTGITKGQPQQRLEIRTLQENEDQFNLYLLALSRMQQTPQDDPFSWYQICAIHGLPMVPWGGAQGVQGGFHGYCPHGSNIFAPWHRPYLALFEQTVHHYMQQVVSEYPKSQRRRYRIAASTFRVPYWDWAGTPPSGQNVVPDIFTARTVRVTAPNGTSTIDNPLYKYTFDPLVPSDFVNYPPYDAYPHTLRQPTSANPNATSQQSIWVNHMNDPTTNTQYKQTLYSLFTTQNNFTIFSNNGFNASAVTEWNNLETIHDSVHYYVGGPNGHITILDFSAFDPVFWLHHVNVDRLYSMWQVLNPDSFVLPMAQTAVSYWYLPGTVLDANSDLLPFPSDTKGNYWTSNTSNNTLTFNYVYPETANATADSMISTVNALYGPNSTASVSKRSTDPSTESSHDGDLWEYLANVRVHRLGLKSSFTVFVFLGNITTDPEDWLHDPNLAGAQPVLASVPNPHRSPTVMSSGSIPLTTKIIHQMGKHELHETMQERVLEHLRQRVHWRVRKTDGSVVPNEDVPGLHVAVASRRVQQPRSETEFPKVLQELRVHTDVTKGKAGGHCESASSEEQ